MVTECWNINCDTYPNDDLLICILKERKHYNYVAFNKICNNIFQIWFFWKMLKCWCCLFGNTFNPQDLPVPSGCSWGIYTMNILSSFTRNERCQAKSGSVIFFPVDLAQERAKKRAHGFLDFCPCTWVNNNVYVSVDSPISNCHSLISINSGRPSKTKSKFVFFFTEMTSTVNFPFNRTNRNNFWVLK